MRNQTRGDVCEKGGFNDFLPSFEAQIGRDTSPQDRFQPP